METEVKTFIKTKEKTITKRGVIWLGQTCNLRCFFCYFLNSINAASHPHHAFMSLEKAKQICKTLVDVYDNNAIDIQGGEPTIYKQIYELIGYCNEIGLKPSLITNAIVLDDIEKVKKLKNAGVRDLLISIQGLREVYDQNVGLKGGSARQMKALENIQEVGIPFRFNTVLNKTTLPQLNEIAHLAVKTGARVVNFIAFNPFVDQENAGIRNANSVPRYSEAVPYIKEAIDILENAGIETNVRYYPLCVIDGKYRKNFYNFQQTNYDTHEWELGSYTWTGNVSQKTNSDELTPPISLEEHMKVMLKERKPLKIDKTLKGLICKSLEPYPKIYHLADVIYKKSSSLLGKKYSSTAPDENIDIHETYRLRAKLQAEMYCHYKYSPKCNKCSVKEICDGFHGDYADIFGFDEVKPIMLDHNILDSRHYILHQEKIVEID
jgi:MoaA/NifB/PqqE/SkfB family radical SAM enzyme